MTMLKKTIACILSITLLLGITTIALTVVPAQVKAQDQDNVNYMISCVPTIFLGVDITIEGQPFHVNPGPPATGSCPRNAAVIVTAFACKGVNFNIANGGGWEIYDITPFVLAARYIGN